VLLVWVLLAFRFAADSDRTDRVLTVGVGVVIAILAYLVSRRPPISRSRNSDLGGSDGGNNSYDSHGSHHHGGDDGGGHGGDGGGDGGH
jgi:hypothetical protein